MQLWLLNRGTGMVLLGVLSLCTALGILATERVSFRWWPRFLTQGLHRNLSLLAVILTLVHAVSAVADEFVDIKWWEIFVPFRGEYRPLALGLGALAFDLMLAIVISSLLRLRLPTRVWRPLHLCSYLFFALSVIHGLGIGTDSIEPWGAAVTAGCLALVVAAIAIRLANSRTLADS
jgi:methionine sulfoxide reductase heme-binding subunit